MITFFRSGPFPVQQRAAKVLCLAAFVISSACPAGYAVTEPSALTGQRQNFAYSWQQEVQQGAEADKEITQQMGLYDNPALQQYVQTVGQRVLAASTFADSNTPQLYRNTQFTFRVLDTPVVNAFALPGGYVYVTRGLLSHVDNEAQLAVVLGHEIGHVAARHASEQAQRTKWGQLGVIAGAILGQAVLGDRMPNIAQNVMNTGSQAMQVFMTRYSREDETQADTLGVNYALNAGYSAGESARFFNALQQLAAQEGQGLPTWMSTHPDPGGRADHVVALVREHRRGPEQREIGQDEYLRHIDGMIIGDDPRQGFAQNGVFYHPTLHFQVPVAPGWKVDNEPTAVVFTDPNGRGVMGLRLAAANRTHDAAAQFASENKVQVTSSGDTSVNGLPTTVIVGRATTNQGQVGVWDAFIELEGKVYSLLGYAPASGFEQMRPTFESVAAGFSPLRDPRLASVEPTHLRIVRTDRSAPFAAFIPTSLPPDFTAQTVAIMNQVAVNETVPRGAAVKIPAASNAPGSAPVLATVPPSGATSYPATSYPGADAYPSASYPQPSYPSPDASPDSASVPQPYPQSPATNPVYPNQYPAPTASYPQPQSPQGQYPESQYPQAQYPQGQYPQSQYPTSSPPPAPSGYPDETPRPAQPPTGYPPPQWPR